MFCPSRHAMVGIVCRLQYGVRLKSRRVRAALVQTPKTIYAGGRPQLQYYYCQGDACMSMLPNNTHTPDACCPHEYVYPTGVHDAHNRK